MYCLGVLYVITSRKVTATVAHNHVMYGFGVQRDPLLSVAHRIACTHLFLSSPSAGN